MRRGFVLRRADPALIDSPACDGEATSGRVRRQPAWLAVAKAFGQGVLQSRQCLTASRALHRRMEVRRGGRGTRRPGPGLAPCQLTQRKCAADQGHRRRLWASPPGAAQTRPSSARWSPGSRPRRWCWCLRQSAAAPGVRTRTDRRRGPRRKPAPGKPMHAPGWGLQTP